MTKWPKTTSKHPAFIYRGFFDTAAGVFTWHVVGFDEIFYSMAAAKRFAKANPV